MYDSVSFVKSMSLFILRLIIFMTGVYVGRDEQGNRYYKSRYKTSDGQEKRWVFYFGEPEPTKIPPEYYAWMHNMQDRLLLNEGGKSYQVRKAHIANLTGTIAAIYPEAYLPSVYNLDEPSNPATKSRYWRPIE